MTTVATLVIGLRNLWVVVSLFAPELYLAHLAIEEVLR